MNDTCEVPRCKKIADIIYYGKNVCGTHFDQHCNNKINLKTIFKVAEGK